MYNILLAGMGGLMASLLGAQSPSIGAGMGGLAGLGSMSGAAMGSSMSGAMGASMMGGMGAGAGGAGRAAAGFDMSNPVMAQLMLQQVRPVQLICYCLVKLFDYFVALMQECHNSDFGHFELCF